MGFHRFIIQISAIFIGFHLFSLISINFLRFSLILEWIPSIFIQFSSVFIDSYRFSWVSVDFLLFSSVFIGFQRFPLISIEFH